MWLIEAATIEKPRKKSEGEYNGHLPVDLERLRAALKIIPNDDLGWEEWNRIGMAIFSATSGSDGGLQLFHEWSEKCPKYNSDKTNKKWDALHGCPPTDIGAGTIFYLADEAKPKPEPYSGGKPDIPQMVRSLLAIPDIGKDVKYGDLAGRNGLMFSFMLQCLVFRC